MTLRTGIVAICFLISRAAAVEPGMPSRTSIWAAAARAVGTHDPDPSIRNPDWLAERLLGPAERALLAGGAMQNALDQDYRVALQNPDVAGLVLGMLVRTRFIDERLEAAIRAGATQVVILGAGFDSRAYRLRQLLRSARVIEVDYGPTQEYKRRRVLEVLGGVPSNLTYAPIDFTRERLTDVLSSSGYRPAEKTFFVWEGVTMYLPEQAVRETLQFMARQSAPGSSVVFDFLSKSIVDNLAQARAKAQADDQHPMARIAGQVAASGEPWIFGLPDDGEREFLRNIGLQAETFLAVRGPDAIKRYVTRKDGSTIQVPVPYSGKQSYWLTEALVAAH
jgi:methyltransferase (TIGR00027 family)